MTCKECLQVLRSLPHDGSGTITAEAREHLGKCRQCRARMAALLLLERGTGLRVQAPDGLAQSIMARGFRPGREVVPRRRLLRWAPVAAAAAAALVLAALLTTHAVKRPAASEQMASIPLTLEAPAAVEVTVVGDWNDWNPKAQPMTRSDGKWEIVLQLKRGRSYQYQFLIDGKTWIADPKNLVRVDNGYGGMNSIIGS